MQASTYWTGRSACALQAALRMSNDAFAGHLYISVRTVAGWHEKPEARPQLDKEQRLDTALARASAEARDRFAALAGLAPGGNPDPGPGRRPQDIQILAGLAGRVPGRHRVRAQRYDLLALEAQSAVRLITTSKYPPLRGTRFTIGDLDYLYTTGYVAALGEFHGMHVPAPLQVADHVGQDTPREALLQEVLALTKLNWNSAALGGLLPVTIKFSRLVGQIMREIPGDREPLPQFKFYI